MTSLFLAAQQTAQGGAGFGGMIFMLVAIFVIMYFFMVRPQQKRQKKIREFQNSLQEGTQIVTGGGLHGTVKKINLENGTVDIQIARDVVVTCDKNYVFADAAAAQPTK